jgi:hypothetical protein
MPEPYPVPRGNRAGIGAGRELLAAILADGIANGTFASELDPALHASDGQHAGLVRGSC